MIPVIISLSREAYRTWATAFKAEPRTLTRRANVAWKSVEVKGYIKCVR